MEQFAPEARGQGLRAGVRGSGVSKIEDGRFKIADWEQSSIGNRQSSRTPPPGSRPLMVLRVFRPPLPATVEVRAGRPVRVFSDFGVRGEVVAAAGPWRTSGEWWTEDGWQQDEWDVELKKGAGAARIEDYRLKIADGKPSIADPGSASRKPSPESRVTVESKGQRTTDNGQQTGLYRIYQDLGSGSWFIRGIYD